MKGVKDLDAKKTPTYTRVGHLLCIALQTKGRSIVAFLDANFQTTNSICSMLAQTKDNGGQWDQCFSTRATRALAWEECTGSFQSNSGR
jgi:hypothetical protein